MQAGYLSDAQTERHPHAAFRKISLFGPDHGAMMEMENLHAYETAMVARSACV
jgi:hypothetical protein